MSELRKEPQKVRNAAVTDLFRKKPGKKLLVATSGE